MKGKGTSRLCTQLFILSTRCSFRNCWRYFVAAIWVFEAVVYVFLSCNMGFESCWICIATVLYVQKLMQPVWAYNITIQYIQFKSFWIYFYLVLAWTKPFLSKLFWLKVLYVGLCFLSLQNSLNHSNNLNNRLYFLHSKELIYVVNYWENGVKHGFNQMEKHVWTKDSMLNSLRVMECFEAVGFVISNN